MILLLQMDKTVVNSIQKICQMAMEDFRLKNIYDLQNNKKEAENYLRELLRMQKLDHLRV